MQISSVFCDGGGFEVWNRIGPISSNMQITLKGWPNKRRMVKVAVNGGEE